MEALPSASFTRIARGVPRQCVARGAAVPSMEGIGNHPERAGSDRTTCLNFLRRQSQTIMTDNAQPGHRYEPGPRSHGADRCTPIAKFHVHGTAS